MKERKAPKSTVLFIFTVLLALPMTMCGGSGGGSDDGNNTGPRYVELDESCMASTLECFDAEGDVTCDGDFLEGSVTFTFESGARIEVTYDLDDIEGTIEYTSFSSSGTECFTVDQLESGGAVITDSRNGRSYTMTYDETTNTLTITGTGCGPDLVVIEETDPDYPIPDLDLTGCL